MTRSRHRMNARNRDRLWPEVVAKQGGVYCVACARTPESLYAHGLSKQLCIDHKDNNQQNCNISNLQLLCKSCNTKKNHPRSPASPPAQDPQTSAELLISRRAEPEFRRFINGEFAAGRRDYPYLELVNDAAELTGTSQETIRRYLAKSCSRFGLYALESREGKVFVVLKPDLA